MCIHMSVMNGKMLFEMLAGTSYEHTYRRLHLAETCQTEGHWLAVGRSRKEG